MCFDCFDVFLHVSHLMPLLNGCALHALTVHVHSTHNTVHLMHGTRLSLRH
jgi:hypothetical protein